MLRVEERHICRIGKPTNFKSGSLHSWNMKSRITCNAMTYIVKGWCWPIGPEWKVSETPKLVDRLFMRRTIMRISFKVKRLKVKVTRLISAEPESERESLRTSRLVRRSSMRYQLPWPDIKPVKLHAGGGLPCRPKPTVTQVGFHLE